MKLGSGFSHVVVIFFGLLIGVSVFLYFTGYGSYSFLFFNIDKNLSAKMLGFVSFGLYTRWCYESPILPNEQGILLFFGGQTGEVWGESNFLFIPRPFWSIWKKVSIQHFTFTVTAQNRTKEGHSMMVFATGKAVPKNVQLLSKISQEGLQEQVLGLSMMAVGSYIQQNKRLSLLGYQSFDISGYVKNLFGKNNLYGLDVSVFTTKVMELSPEIARQFDLLAISKDMGEIMKTITRNFPDMSPVERYATYASLSGLNPSVMSYVIHGKGTNNLLLGRDGEH